MARTGEFEHSDLRWIHSCRFGHFGENLAMGFGTPEAAVGGWMESPGHRANMLNPEYRFIGIGWAGPYATQHLAA